MNFINSYLKESKLVIDNIDSSKVKKIIDLIKKIKLSKGRIFFLGCGGSAGNSSHAVNDFRKILGIECYAATDNVSELTARINDDGWETVFINWLKVSNLSKKDMIFIFSVGGGDLEKNISSNLVRAIDYAKSVKATVCGIVGKDGGYTLKNSDCCVVIPTVNKSNITPHSEAFQAVIWHLIVSHPDLKVNETKWESVSK